MTVQLITNRWADRGLVELDHDDESALADLLLGHKVEKVADDHILLDDGTLIRVVPNRGCSCEAGDYELADLNSVDNIITAVTATEREIPTEYEGDEPDRVYEVFVVAEHKKLKLLSVSGNDGNGFYGTGYRLLVRRPS